MIPGKSPKKEKTNPNGDGLNEEIRILRSIIRQVASMTGDDRPADGLLDILRAVGEASARLATLIKAQHELVSSADLPSALNQTLALIVEEMRAKGEPVDPPSNDKQVEGEPIR